VACSTSSVKDEAQQIVQQREHVAAVETMTGLLEAQQVAESRGTAVAVAGRVTATAVALSAQQTTTVGAVQAGETATARAAQVAVRETQAPIIAAATVAAAQDAAKAQATAIVEAADRAQSLAAQATATAQVDAAQARANAETERASFAAWEQRRDSAAHYVASCPIAMRIASETASLPAAIATARADQAGLPVGTCATSTPPSRHPRGPGPRLNRRRAPACKPPAPG
jgi:hypothetical protein